MDYSVACVRTICFLLFTALVTANNDSVFDVKQYGAKADGKSDDSQAITNAWKDACGSTNTSTVIIPGGMYIVGPLKFQGPCKSPITIEAQGTLQAPTDINKMKSQDGWVVFHNIDRLTLSGGTFDGQGALAWKQNDCAKTGKCNSLPINLRFNAITNTMITNITSLNSKLFHMNLIGCRNVTLEHVIINAPEDSPNTDGIHIGRSNGINITDANIQTGDDCVSLGDGSQQVNVEKVTCGPGHGISVGSLGKYHNEEPVVGITVRNCTLKNTMNGIRVKTWPASPSGVARELHFEDIAMDNVSTPILIDQQYCPYGQCQAQIPSRVKISDVSFTNIRGTSASQLTIKLVCSRGIPCENVQISNINLAYHGANGSATSECSNINPKLSGQLFPSPCAISSH